MDEPVEHDGTWWRRGHEGEWLRWDPIASAWLTSPTGPHGEPAAGHAPAPPAAPFEPLEGHMRWAAGFLMAAVVFDLIAVLSGIQEYLLVGRIAEGTTTREELRSNDARQALVGLLQLGLLIVAGIAFLRWFRRAYRNIPGLGEVPRHRPGWAVGAWFVPLLNLVRPKRMTDELWRSTFRPEEQQAGVPAYVHLWWAAWLATNFVGYIASQAYVAAEDTDALRSAATWIVAADALSVLAGILAIRLVRDITGRQHAKRAAVASQPGDA